MAIEPPEYVHPTALAADDSVPAWRKTVVILLTLGGLLVYFAMTVHWPVTKLRDVSGALRPVAVVIVLAAIALIPFVQRPVARILERLRNLSPASRALVTLLVWLIAATYFGWTAWHQGRDFSFKTQDEFMYLVQVQPIAHGHLYMPPHPLGDFFQEFYTFTRPVTSGMYFPGTAMAFAPAVWLHVPLAWWAVLIAGGVVAMTYRVTAGILNDSVLGLLAALLLVSLSEFRTLSLETVSYIPFALMALSMWWAYLHWREGRGYVWAIVIGALAGWSAITRPLDAIVYFLPLFCLMIGDWKDSRRGGSVLAALILMAIAAAPFLFLQLKLDHAVTGHWLKTPVQEYQDRYWPGTVGGRRPHVLPGKHRLATDLPQFQDDYEHFVLPHYRGKTRPLSETYVKVMQYALPHYLLFVPLVLSVMAIPNRRRFAFLAILPLFPTAYLAWVMFNKPYAAVVSPVMMFGIVMGAAAVRENFPRRRAFMAVWLTSSIAALAVMRLPELYGPDKTTGSIVMTTFNRAIPSLHNPSIVLFRYHPEVPGMWKHEQVYNVEAAWFNDEQVIRAHDLGDRDVELLNYYAAKQSNRTVYLFDQATMKLIELGNVKELAEHPEQFKAKLAAVSKTIPVTQPVVAKKRIRNRGRK